MKPRTLGLLGLPLIALIIASAAWFHYQHEDSLHRAGVLSSISKIGRQPCMRCPIGSVPRINSCQPHASMHRCCISPAWHGAWADKIPISWGHLVLYNAPADAGACRSDHDRFLKAGIDCEEVYHVQGYEGPEAFLRCSGAVPTCSLRVAMRFSTVKPLITTLWSDTNQVLSGVFYFPVYGLPQDVLNLTADLSFAQSGGGV